MPGIGPANYSLLNKTSQRRARKNVHPRPIPSSIHILPLPFLQVLAPSGRRNSPSAISRANLILRKLILARRLRRIHPITAFTPLVHSLPFLPLLPLLTMTLFPLSLSLSLALLPQEPPTRRCPELKEPKTEFLLPGRLLYLLSGVNGRARRVDARDVGSSWCPEVMQARWCLQVRREAISSGGTSGIRTVHRPWVPLRAESPVPIRRLEV